MRFFVGNGGFTVPFGITKTDGTTRKDITGLTLKWYFLDEAGNAPTGSPITGVITDASQGEVDFVVPAGVCAAEIEFISQVNMSDGVDYDEDTEIFTVNIAKRSH